MTRRERIEARIEKRRTWAASSERKSTAAFDTAHRISSMIPFGQPILVGHHSEAHARRDADRICNNMDKACEMSKKAEEHESKAAGLQHQLETCIFSDDENAIQAITDKVNGMKTRLEHMRAANKAWKKSGVAGLVSFGYSQEEAERIARAIETAYSWDKKPFATYEITNLSGNIRRMEQRIPEIQRRNDRAKQAEEAGGMSIQLCGTGNEYARVTFAEKPDYSIIQDLKAAGFRWQSGCWFGAAASIPESVRELETTEHAAAI